MTPRPGLAALGRQALLLAALAAGPLAAALGGAAAPFRLTLNLGPGDGPYVEGFTPRHEVEDKVGTHWSSYDASVSLPLAVRGGPLELSYRFARVFPQTAAVEVLFQGQRVDRFSCRGGVFEERRVAIAAAGPGPVSVAFHADSHEGRNLGLRLDWVRLEAREGARVRLAAGARWRAPLLMAVLFLLLRGAGWGSRGAALLVAPWAAAATAGLLLDPWLVHRLLTWVPEAVAVLGAVGLAAARLVQARRVAPIDLRHVTALAAATFLLRALALNHPDFYYPDLMLHARLVGVVQTAGPRFLLHPAAFVWGTGDAGEGAAGGGEAPRAASGLWLKEVHGVRVGMPYSLAFHVPFALLGLDYDALLTALKLAGAAFSVAPVVGVWVLARRIGASPLGAALTALVPCYLDKLSLGALPATFGHAVDVAFLCWLSGRLENLAARRVWMTGAAFVAACQLAYVSAVVQMSLLLAVLALFVAREGDAQRWQRAAAVLLMGAAGSALSVLLYYRDFLGAVGVVLAQALGPGPQGPSAAPGALPVVSGRILPFYGSVLPLLAAAGLVLLLRRESGRAIIGAWAATCFGLLALRAGLPDVFRWLHEELLATPLLCLAAGQALAVLAANGPRRRALAGVLLAALAAEGLLLQWRALGRQLANAL